MKTVTFICGCGHTGTSLLANMFAAHPDVFVPLRETETFLDEASASSRWADLLNEANRSGKSHLVEKTPRHIHRLGLIRARVPQARVIVTVRDGRDVAASYIKRAGSADRGIERWLAESALVRAALGADWVLMVRYEDLIEAPEAQLRRACEFAGIPFSGSMLRYHEQKRLWFGVSELRKGSGAAGLEHRLLRNWQINQPLFDGRAAWKGKLLAEHTEVFANGPGRELMDFFGYPQ